MDPGLKKLLQIGILACVVLLVYFRYFKYIDSAHGCSISVRPFLLEWNSRNIYDALGALKYGDPEQYNYVCKNITKISGDYSCGGWEGGCYYRHKGEIFLSTARNEYVAWTAAVIAHETCHDRQFKRGETPTETECYEVGHSVLVKLSQVDE